MSVKTYAYTLNGKRDTAVGKNMIEVAVDIINGLNAHIVKARFRADGTVEYVLSHGTSRSILSFPR